MYPQLRETHQTHQTVTTGIRNLKNNLSRYVSSVKEGTVVLITEHGRPVARIVPNTAKKVSLQGRLALLVAKGLVELPEHDLNKKFSKPLSLKGKPLSHYVIEDRR